MEHQHAGSGRVWVVLLAALTGATGILVPFGLIEPDTDAADLAARWTARLAFIWFMLVWSASAIEAQWPGGWRLSWLQQRRGLGLAFAAAHGVHLIALLIAMHLSGRSMDLPHLLGGGMAYLFVLAMAATSNDRAVRALGIVNWRRLHATGGWLLAAIFSLTYLRGLAQKPIVSSLALFCLFAVAALKLGAMRRRPTEPRNSTTIRGTSA